MGCDVAGTWLFQDSVAGKQDTGIHLISGSENRSPALCRCTGRCVFRVLLGSQGRQMCFEAVEVSELFSWLRSPKDRERGWASNDELDPALFEVIGRNSWYRLQALCVWRSTRRAKCFVFCWPALLASWDWGNLWTGRGTERSTELCLEVSLELPVNICFN